MKTIINIARIELQKMFYSPIAWLVLIIFSIQSGIQYIGIINNWIRRIEIGYNAEAITTQVYAGGSGFFSQIQTTLYLYIPLITMGLISKEFSSGSIKLLYSSPITNKQIVLGKYLAALVFCSALVSILLIESIFGFVIIKDFDFPQVLTGLLGMFLVIAAYSAIGLFMSSLTSYQIVAAIGSFAVFFALQQIGNLWQTVDFVKDISYWLSIGGRSQTFIQGLISSEDFLYFILVSTLFIVFTIYRLRGVREKSSKYISLARYIGSFAVVALIGFTSTIPSLIKYYDVTRTNLNTLTENSQHIISKLKGKVKITTYVNILGPRSFFGLPEAQKRDEDTFEKYRRFYPDMDMEYKYYYAIPVQEQFARSHNARYAGLTMDEVLDKVCNLYDMNKDDIKPAEYFIDEIDLKSELNRFVRKIETEDGKSSYLRIYDDVRMLPSESEITAAFKKLVSKLTIVGFVTGHEERNINNFGSRGYNTLAKEKPFRYSLVNNGIDVTECQLSTPIDEDINILMIIDSKKSFSEEEHKNLNDYINRGGNLILASDINRQEFMNPLVERFGVTFQPGQIVEYNKGYTMDLVTANVTNESRELSYRFNNIKENEGVVSMDGAVAITYKKSNEFNYIPVLASDAVKNKTQLDSIGSWNELKTTNFIDEVAKYNSEEEDVLGALTTALTLTRKVENKEQKILILGDADWLSNEKIRMRRKGIDSRNFNMASGIFFWLSDKKSPIDVRRPENPDNTLLLKKDDMSIYNLLYKVFIPLLLATWFLLIWLRRKGR